MSNNVRNALVSKIAYRARVLTRLSIKDLRSVASQEENRIYDLADATRGSLIQSILNYEFQK